MESKKDKGSTKYSDSLASIRAQMISVNFVVFRASTPAQEMNKVPKIQLT